MVKVNPNAKYLSEARVTDILALVNSNPSNEVFEHVVMKFGKENIDATYVKKLYSAYSTYFEDLEDDAFNGKRMPITPELGDLALSQEAKTRGLNSPMPNITFDIRYVEENKDLEQERQIPVAFFIGKDLLPINEYASKNNESSEDCHVKLLGIWSDTWLRSLGLDYDFEKSSIVDKVSRQVPSKQEFEKRIIDTGLDAQKRYTDKAKKSGLLQENGEITVSYAALDFSNRQRAEPVAVVP